MINISSLSKEYIMGDNKLLALNNIDLSIAGLKYGLKGEIIVNGKSYNSYMAYQGLENDEIADIMNYILNEWGNNSEEFITSVRVDKVEKSILK